MTTAPTPTKLPILGLTGIDLKRGSHDSRNDGVCAMEAAAWIAGEQHSDEPVCVCRVLRNFLMNWNDGLRNDEDRNRILKPLIPLCIGTRSTAAVEQKRADLAYNWFLTVYTPAWLELAKLDDHAKAVRENPSLENLSAADSAARSAAYSAACSAAYSAADSAADSAARSAAYSAAYSAACSAADSAADSAARSAACSALKATEEQLQISAAELFRQMVAVTE